MRLGMGEFDFLLFLALICEFPLPVPRLVPYAMDALQPLTALPQKSPGSHVPNFSQLSL